MGISKYSHIYALTDGHKYRHPHRLKPKIYWYQTDHLGTPYALTDKQGRIAWRCEYSAYGKVLSEEILEDERTGNRLIGVRNPLRFQGQYEDEESGFFYNLNRYYDPGAGRYLTQDPVKLAGGLNPYVYVDGNPVSWIDPLGLFKQDGTGFENSSVNNSVPEIPRGDNPYQTRIDTSTFGSGTITSNGGIRNNREFWEQWSELQPDSLSNSNLYKINELGLSPTIDSTWIKMFPEHANYKGDKLIHHHINMSIYAIPVPAKTHVGSGGIWHTK